MLQTLKREIGDMPEQRAQMIWELLDIAGFSDQNLSK